MRRNVRSITRTGPRPGNRPRLLSARSVSRLGNVLRPRTFVVAAVAMLLSGGAYAFTASNTVDATAAGNGAGGISGYTVSNVSYTLSTASPGTPASPVITAVSFDLSATATGSNVSAVISAGTPGSPSNPQATYGSCGSSTVSAGTTITCNLSASQTAESVADATVLTVTAAQ